MAAKCAHIDCTKYNWKDFVVDHPEIKCNRVSFQRIKALQLRNPETIPPEPRSINRQNNSSVQNNSADDKNPFNSQEKENTTKLPNSGIIPEDVVQNLIDSSIKSLQKHIPTQWQAAARTLEALVPEQYAKRSVEPVSKQGTVGIRLVITDDPDGKKTVTIEGAVK
jgi:hypothetical protein